VAHNSVAVTWSADSWSCDKWSCDKTDLRPIKTGFGIDNLQDVVSTFCFWTYNEDRAGELMFLCRPNLTPADNTTFILCSGRAKVGPDGARAPAVKPCAPAVEL